MPKNRVIIWDTYSKLRGRRDDRLLFLGQYIHGAAAVKILAWGEASDGLPTLVNALRWKPTIPELFGTSTQKTKKTIRTRKSKTLHPKEYSQRLKRYIFFWYQTTLHTIKKSEKTPRDFRALEIIGTSVQWGVRMEGTDDITLLFLNYLGHKLSRIFGPKEIEWFSAEIQLLEEHSEIVQFQLPSLLPFIIRDL